MCVWTEDADSIRFGEKPLEIVYRNPIINGYLRSNRRLGLAGTKGQGKTFLLKVKRQQYQGKKEEGNGKGEAGPPIICFPKDAMVDTLYSSIAIMGTGDTFISIDSSLRRELKEFDIWKQLWKISIAVCIVGAKEFSGLFSKKELNALNNISKSLLDISNEDGRPSIIFQNLLRLKYKNFKLIIQDTPIWIQLLTKLNCAAYFFIDKVDQAFSEEITRIALDGDCLYSRNASYWQYAQFSLAGAAYELFSSVNTHVKVFFTIRHEALVDCHRLSHNLARNIESFVSELVYTKEDIFEMFSLYVENENDDNLAIPQEKRSNPERAFLGIDRIQHAYVANANEKVFAFLYRHSLRRPYDVMKICHELYLKNPRKLTATIIRHTVNDISNKVLDTYLSEMEPFTIFSTKNIRRLLGCINTNFFDLNYIQYVCKRYNRFFAETNKCLRNCQVCANAHPFSELYNIGLIGCIRNSAANPIYAQEYLAIGASKLRIDEYDLPDSPIFFLHPCLCDVSRKIRSRTQRAFCTTNEVVAGESIQVTDEALGIIKQALPDRIAELEAEKVFVSSTVNDLTQERQAVKTSLFNMGFYPIMSESMEFEYGANSIHSHDHCIKEALKCKKMVFLVGEKYGDPYSGNDYKKYVTEIQEASNGLIEEPSISLVELYAAIKNGLQYYVFVKQDVLNQKRLCKNGEIVEGIDKRVFTLINFINHLKFDGTVRGNWFISFRSEKDLIGRLSAIGLQ